MNAGRRAWSRWLKPGVVIAVSSATGVYFLNHSDPDEKPSSRFDFNQLDVSFVRDLIGSSSPLSSAWMEARFSSDADPVPLFAGQYFNVTENTKRTVVPLSSAISHARELCQRRKDETGSPGMTIAVSVDGEIVYSEGFGYADVEQRVKCVPDTVMRIASISKSITMAIVAKLVEENKLDLDKPISEYVKDFPEKIVDGEKVTITTRHLVSHLGGIRHYEKKEELEKKRQKQNQKGKTIKSNNSAANNDEFKLKEYYFKEYFATVKDSLEIFKDDELIAKPGEKFLYTTHGWTLISAVVEAVCQKPFSVVAEESFRTLGLQRTYLDKNSPIIYGRARCYVKDVKGMLVNAQYSDNSYKWAGGGFLSTVDDLVKFGNVMLYCYQTPDYLFGKPAHDRKGFLKQSTVRTLWTPVPKTLMGWDKDGSYGMGWGVVPNQENFRFGNARQFYASHTGGAVGASSVLLILPDYDVFTPSSDAGKGLQRSGFESGVGRAPTGVVVAIIANMGAVGLNSIAKEIATVFSMTR